MKTHPAAEIFPLLTGAEFDSLVTDIGADYVSIQIASVDPASAIELVGRDVLPALRELAG